MTEKEINSKENINAESDKKEVDQRSPWQRDPTFRFKVVAIISLGFFASSAAWSLYNSSVSDAFEELLKVVIPTGYLTVVGFIMTLDNIVGAILQPIMGGLSDRTKSRFGRRMPYIMIFLPLSTIAFMIIPFVEKDFTSLLTVVMFFNVFMACWRSQTVALMPDFVAPKDRSKGNGIVNFLGGLGSVFSFAIGGMLITSENTVPGFITVGIVMLIALIVLVLGIKEPDTRNWDFTSEKTKEKIGIIESLKEIRQEKEKSIVFMLLAIFSWFVAYAGLESLWTVYATDPSIFNMDRGDATQMLTFVALPFMIFAIPAGYLAKKIKRKNTIMLGLIICTVDIFIANWIKGAGNLLPFYIIFPTFGLGWAFININSITMVWEMVPSPKHIGTYTGLYYFASFLAQITGPVILGFFTDFIVGLENMFIVCTIWLILALVFMTFVKKGEVTISTEEVEAKKQAIQNLS
ncbi:MAG: MFS transporter [Promethearchaeota archaeon]